MGDNPDVQNDLSFRSDSGASSGSKEQSTKNVTVGDVTDIPVGRGRAEDTEDEENEHDSQPDLEKEYRSLKPCPEDTANILSITFYSWLSDLIKRGSKGPLEHHDLYALSEEELVGTLTDTFYELYPRHKSVIKTLFMVNKASILEAAFFQLIYAMCQMINPLLLRELVSRITDEQGGGMYFAFGLGLSSAIGSIANQRHLHKAFRVGQRMRALVISLVYRHSFELNEAARSEVSQGAIVTLLANDSQKFFELMPLVNLLWAAPVQIAFATYFLIQFVGLPALAGISMLFLLVPLSTVLGRIGAYVRSKHMPITDDRAQATTELLHGIRVVKLFGWEMSYVESILTKRLRELYYVRIEIVLWACTIFTLIVFPMYAMLFTFTTYAQVEGSLNAADTFAALAFFNVLKFPLMYLGQLITTAVQAYIAAGRLEVYLSRASTEPTVAYTSQKTSQKAQDTTQKAVNDRNVKQDSVLFGDRSDANLIATPAARVVPTQGLNPSGSSGIEDKATLTDEPNYETLKSESKHTLCEAMDDSDDVLNIDTAQKSYAIKIDNATFRWDSHTTGRIPANDPEKGVLKIEEQSERGSVAESKHAAMGAVTGSYMQNGGDEIDLGHGDRDMEKMSRNDFSCNTSFAMSDLNLEVQPGELVAVVGVVGSGKSMLMMAILRELNCVSGSVHVQGDVAYAAQEPFVLSGTVKDNILFGAEFDEDKYRTVLDACCLWRDLDELVDRDRTLIGERGVTLSGGQKARVSLARAAYANSDIVLLDDPLSALDAQTGRQVFDQLLGSDGLLSRNARVLVTHAVQYLSLCDRIVVLDNGRILYQGSYDTLMTMTNTDAQTSAVVGAILKSDQETGEKREAYALDDTIVDTTSTASGLDDATAKTATAKPASNALGKKSTVFMTKEERATGAVGWSVYRSYIRNAGGMWTFSVLLFCLFMERATYIMADWWLAMWSSAETGPPDNNIARAVGLPAGDTPEGIAYYNKGYGALVAINTIFVLGRTQAFAFGGAKAAKGLFEGLLHSVVRTPISFFETTPIGRIVNRFSYDMELIEFLVPTQLSAMLASSAWIISSVFVMTLVTPISLAVVAPIMIVFLVLQSYFRRTLMQLQRLDSVSRSPIQAHFAESLAGMATIRAYGQSQRFINMNQTIVDRNNTALLAFTSCQRWLGVRLELMGAAITLTVCLCAWLGRSGLTGGLAGLAIMWTFNITVSLNFFVTFAIQSESKMNSVERVVHYATELAPEAPLIIDDNRPPEGWPSKGEVRMSNAQMQYRPELPLSLRGLDVIIKPGHHVGVVGRTGAGKSTIAVTLFRLVELCGGKITIDGVDISKIGLNDLRGRGVCIIPQDPVLFSGPVRYNMDPFDQFTDDEIWQALTHSRIADTVKDLPGGLQFPLDERGMNFSTGQRQLLCLARALLRKPRILIMDEATASVDSATDTFVQETVRTWFRESTVIEIAHRLHSVMDVDRVLVMSAGKAVEYDTPVKLLETRGGVFRGLVEANGRNTAQKLSDMAYDAERRRNKKHPDMQKEDTAELSQSHAAKIDESGAGTSGQNTLLPDSTDNVLTIGDEN